MTTSDVQKSLETASQHYASKFNQGSLDKHPAKHYAIVTCMDARLDPAAAFGINLGDAHVIRNAGGSATEALRSIVISEQMLGTKEVLIVKHTGCGMQGLTNDVAFKTVSDGLGSDGPDAVAEWKKQNFDFIGFQNLEQSVKEDVHFLKSSKLIPKSVTVSGWVYDVKTGETKLVE